MGCKWVVNETKSITYRSGGKKSGQARRAKTAERDTAIIQAIQAGQSMRAVGRVYGLDESSVRHIIKRGAG